MAEPYDHLDAPHESGNDRYAVYVMRTGRQTRLGETSQSGIGLCLVTLHDEGEWDDDDRVGIYDRRERHWVVSPYARGR